MNTFPKNSPSHCKLEVYLAPYGWVSFDVSETQRLMQAIGKDQELNEADRQKLQTAAFDRLKQGFRDGVRGLIVSGFASMYTFVKYAKLWAMTASGHGAVDAT